jgi:hypothetical protein
MKKNYSDEFEIGNFFRRPEEQVKIFIDYGCAGKAMKLNSFSDNLSQLYGVYRILPAEILIIL